MISVYNGAQVDGIIVQVNIRKIEWEKENKVSEYWKIEYERKVWWLKLNSEKGFKRR